MRLRIGLAGRLWGFLPICWTLVDAKLPANSEAIAQALTNLINGRPVNEKHLQGIVFARVDDCRPKESTS